MQELQHTKKIDNTPETCVRDTPKIHGKTLENHCKYMQHSNEILVKHLKQLEKIGLLHTCKYKSRSIFTTSR
jgi:ribosomal protein S19E (S16A)